MSKRLRGDQRDHKNPVALLLFAGTIAGLAVLGGGGGGALRSEVACAAPNAPLTCSGTPTTAALTPTFLPPGQCVVPRYLRIAVVGDYGACTEDEARCLYEASVARAIVQTKPDAVIAVGDLNYSHGHDGPAGHPPPSGSNPAHISQNNLRVFPPELFPTPLATLPPPRSGWPAALAFPPLTPYPSEGVELYETFIEGNRFLPTWGNHDYRYDNANPAKAFFQRADTYAVQVGPVIFVAVDSNEASVTGNNRDGEAVAAGADPPSLAEQEPAVVQWLDTARACWRVVFMHHPAYSRGVAGGGTIREPYPGIREFIDNVNDALSADKQIDVVLAGHLHALEALRKDGGAYVLSGAGGENLYRLESPTDPGVDRLPPSNDESHGFFLLDFWFKPNNDSMRIALVTVDETNPGEENWYDRYSSKQHLIAWQTPVGSTTPCAEYPWCEQSEACEDIGATPTPMSTSIATCEGNPTQCFSLFKWFQAERPSCDEERRLIRAKITLPICTSVACTPAICCPVQAVGRNLYGHHMARICLEPVYVYPPSGPPVITHFEGYSDCIFDEFTTPLQWSVHEIGTTDCSYSCSSNGKRLQVEYFCCECFALIPTNTPTPDALIDD